MDRYNAKHIAFIIAGVAIVALKTYPTILIRNAGRDTWVAVIFASILIFFYFYYLLKICKKTNTYNLYEIYCKGLGKKLGTIFFILFLLTLFLTMIESASVEAHAMHNNMLLETPTWFFLLFFIIPGLYTVMRGKAAIMTTTLIVIVLVTISGINLAILTAGNKNFAFLLPIFKDGVTIGFVKAVLQTVGLYGPIAIVFAYIDEVKDKKGLIKYQIIGILFVIQMEIVSLTGVLATFDIGLLENMTYPKLEQTQLVDLLRFLESGEFFVMLQIVGGWYIKYILTFFALSKLLKNMNLPYDSILYGVSALCFGIAYYATDNLFRFLNFLNYFSYISLVSYVLIPFIVFTIFLVRYKEESTIKG